MQLLKDASHFLVDFHDILVLSPLHTYFTALASSPRDSALYKWYGLELRLADYAANFHKAEWASINGHGPE